MDSYVVSNTFSVKSSLNNCHHVLCLSKAES